MARSTDYQDVVGQRVRENEADDAGCVSQGGMKIYTPAGGFKIGASTRAAGEDPQAVRNYLDNDPGKDPDDRRSYYDILVGTRGGHSGGEKVS